MSNLQKLREDHAELVKIVQNLGELIARPAAPQQLELFEVRRLLNSTLIAHLKAEDWVLYPRLAESADAEIAATAKAFSEEMGGLAAAYSAHVDKWNAAAIDADWPGYCRETRAVLDKLTCRITRENRELYPLMERLERAA